MTDRHEQRAAEGAWADAYRARWKWDKVVWGTHCVDCYPSNCPYRVYVKDCVVVREEPAGNFETIEAGVPDMNPAGCQKGAAWSQTLSGQDRVLYPLRRAARADPSCGSPASRRWAGPGGRAPTLVRVTIAQVLGASL